ncbi:hypothetical protein [Glycomyces arizonensis]|uniref:hypothetical protein n=1 Tax=Glycomyces arizonensis TaxID=256035 RepID=UPI0012EBE857|nr:hypothetical protein [Glycomyces arizonensis]
MTGRDHSIRVTGERRRRIDTRRLAEALVRIAIRDREPEDHGREPQGVIDRDSEPGTEGQR